jgi:hypothetical protein
VKSFGKKLCGVDYSVLEKKLEGEWKKYFYW